MLRTVLSAAGSVVYVALAGILSIQAQATMTGAVLNIAGEPVAVREPAIPWLQYAALALASATFVALLWGESRKREARAFPPAFAGVLALGLLIIVTFVSTDAPYRGGIGSQLGPILTWLQAGGLSPAVHACLAILVWRAWVTYRARGGVQMPADAEATAGQ